MKEFKFKTNINCDGCKSAVQPFLDAKAGIEQWHVDIDSPDKILSVHTTQLSAEEIMSTIQEAGYTAEKVDEA